VEVVFGGAGFFVVLAGKIYRELEPEVTGRPEKSAHGTTTFTTKQSAEKETGKDKSTLNRWATESAIEKGDDFNDKAGCPERPDGGCYHHASPPICNLQYNL
jgi:hypothetical protein